MKCRVIIKLIAVCLCCLWVSQAQAQSLTDSLADIPSLLLSDHDDEASDLLTALRGRCLSSGNDTAKFMYDNNMGLLMMKRKRYAEAIKHYRSVVQLSEKANLKGPDYYNSFLLLGMCHQRLGQDSLAEKCYRTGLLKSFALDDLANITSSCYLNLGQLYEDRGDSVLARLCYDNIDPKHFFDLRDAKADFLSEDGETKAIDLRKKGEFEQCLPIYDRLLARTRKLIGTQNEDYARLLYSKGVVLDFNLSRPQEARPLFKELFDMRDSLPQFNIDILEGTARYLKILAEASDTTQVDSLFPIALDYALRSSDERNISQLYRVVGNGYYWAHHYRRAIPYYEKYVSFQEKESGLSYLEIPNMLGVCYLATGEPVKAQVLLANLMATYGDDIEGNADMKMLLFHNYGTALMRGGLYKDAVGFLEASNTAYKAVVGKDNPSTLEYIEECKKHL